MAVSLTLESAFKAFLAAPVPPPPQPIRPSLSRLFSPAKRPAWERASPPAIAEVVRKSRRVVVGSGFIAAGLRRRGGRGREGLLCGARMGIASGFGGAHSGAHSGSPSVHRSTT